MLKAEWKTAGGREAKYYSLTRAGRQQLQAETEGWERLCAAVRLVLETSK
jgi:DNA-binding PadR family transcriptional regulator